MKLEGKCNLSADRKSEFQFHLGGYQFPNSGLQFLSFMTNTTANINIDIDLKMFMDQVNLSQNHHIMSPNSKAVSLAYMLSETFKLSTVR